MVERKTLNLVVEGSIPSEGAFFFLLQLKPVASGRYYRRALHPGEQFVRSIRTVVALFNLFANNTLVVA